MEWESTGTSRNTGGNLRRRHQAQDSFSNNSHYSNNNNNDSKYDSKKLSKKVVRNLDLFPKIEQDLIAKPSNNNRINTLTYISYILTIIIITAEIYSHNVTNHTMKEHVTVDKSLNKKMRVDLNITFPALHCDDVHMDIMDVAGDAHCNVEDTLVKKRLHKDGSLLSNNEIIMDLNQAHEKEKEVLDAIDKTLAKDYCGPCYGSGEEGECCNHCQDVMDNYVKKKWSTVEVKMIAEQCVREGKTVPTRMKWGEGCNIAGYMQFNRVNGNFHIAMGEGVERNGQHIHSFIPDDVGNFNASHIIHELRFGPDYSNGLKTGMEPTTLEGVTKIVTEKNGKSGMFQYFIKIVPTTYKGKKVVKSIAPDYEFSNDANDIPELETNRYFTTERFTPLMMDISDENWKLGELVSKKHKEHDEKSIEDAFEEGIGEPGRTPDPGEGKGNPSSYYDDDYYNFFNERQEMPDLVAGAKVGGNSGTSHNHHEHHRSQQAILPGIFFIYQVYPFAVEISKDHVPLTHLFIRILSTIGGIFTIMGMIDTISSRLSGRRPR